MASLYDTDFYAWTQEQSAKLRALLTERTNLDLDIENLVEEVDGMAGGDRKELVNRFAIILVHLLKLAYCFYPDPRKTWRDSVQAQRTSIDIMFDQSPSLRRLAPELLTKAYNKALAQTKNETIDLSMEELPTVNPFDLDDVLDLTYIPEPPVRL
jgi:hypothetical protein